MSGQIKDIDRGWNRIKKEIKKMKNSFVKIGVLSDSGSYEAEGKANLADVATWNEFGTSKIDSRPFMAQSFDTNIEGLKRFIEKEKDTILEGAQNTQRALDRIGVFFTGKVKEQFTKGKFKENAPYTIKKKGSDRPLIDTGRLRNSINHKVENE